MTFAEWGLLTVALGVPLGLALVAYLMLCDRKRFLRQYDLAGWRDRQYLAMLPNFLQAAYDAQLDYPWPKRLHTLSALLFRWRVRAILKERPGLVRRRFIHYHLNLRALLDILRPFLEDALLAEEHALLSAKLAEVATPSEREHLNHFLAGIRVAREQFRQRLQPADRQLMWEMQDRRFFEMLRTLNAVFREHGYVLLPALEQLRRWENLPGDQVARELPTSGEAPLWRFVPGMAATAGPWEDNAPSS